ncbi:Concanavalin A-like lectin/glucanases superfamily [Corchorus capsularis]|uniref:Concanavalin A-like lectin/glucanases superfamily n=1 Tax=Corchorus capsularis TaxID=210143 RepID=A0A1R3GCX5_COCAP|nr:Concanavalin A-like lectin/glucanases superfamily [Corchorus capsularis]
MATALGYDYSSGVWQFEGYSYVPSRNGTSGVCIMQVFGASSHATTLMLRVYKGSLYYYREGPIEKNIYDRWFKLNVIHDVDASKLKVYIDGVLKLEAPGRGGENHYFKFGVYSQDDASHYMESRWKHIKGYDYSSGVHQFEGYFYVPSHHGTSGVCIMQIFGASPPHASTLMLRVYNGKLYYYRSGKPLLENIYDKWFRLNVIHDVDASKVHVYINGVKKLEADGRGGTNHFYKFGVYAQEGASHYMESRWKGIKIFKMK